jgi:hypothetical protein
MKQERGSERENRPTPSAPEYITDSDGGAPPRGNDDTQGALQAEPSSLRIAGPRPLGRRIQKRDYSEKGLSFISNRQRRKEGTFGASELAGIEPTPPAPEEQGMRAFRQLG